MVVRALLAVGAIVNAENIDGCTALVLASEHGYTDVVRVLLAGNANVNAAASNGITPLHEAAAKNHKDIAELLLANKAAVNPVDSAGHTPLPRRHAVHFGYGQRHRRVAAPARWSRMILIHPVSAGALSK